MYDLCLFRCFAFAPSSISAFQFNLQHVCANFIVIRLIYFLFIFVMFSICELFLFASRLVWRVFIPNCMLLAWKLSTFKQHVHRHNTIPRPYFFWVGFFYIRRTQYARSRLFRLIWLSRIIYEFNWSLMHAENVIEPAALPMYSTVLNGKFRDTE